MKIAFILPSLANKGPVVATRDIIESLKESMQNIEISVYYFDEIIELDMGVAVNKISFWDNIDFSSYDVIHSSNIRPDLFVWFNAFIRQAGIKDKIIATMHNIMHDDLRLTYGKLISKIASFVWLSLVNSFKFIIVSSEEMKNYYKDYIPQEKLIIIPYGRARLLDNEVPTEDGKILLDLKNKYKIIGSIARLTERKNIQEIIYFLQDHPEYALVALGEGEQKESLIALSNSLGVAQRVLFLGVRPDSRKYYQFFDIFCLPSRSEGFALVVIDAMAYKVPIVLSNLDNYKNYLKRDEVSFFELDDELSFQDAVYYAYSNQDELSSKAFSKYQSNFSMKLYAEKHFDIYSKIAMKA